MLGCRGICCGIHRQPLRSVACMPTYWAISLRARAVGDRGSEEITFNGALNIYAMW